jgi:hypothetical protein
MNCLRSRGRCDRGFESHLGHGCSVCVCAFFCVCVVLYLGRGLATGRSLVQGVLQIVYRSKENLYTVRVRYKRNGYKKNSIPIFSLWSSSSSLLTSSQPVSTITILQQDQYYYFPLQKLSARN